MGNSSYSTRLVSTLWATAQSLILRCSQQGTVWRYVVSISTELEPTLRATAQSLILLGVTVQSLTLGGVRQEKICLYSMWKRAQLGT
jgi:hypothetical protein